MRGYPKYNFPLFDKISEIVRSHGAEAVNPADIDREHEGTKDEDLPENGAECTGTGDQREIAKRDLNAVLDCDGIVMLPSWENSIGAKAELAAAEWAGLKIFHTDGEKIYEI